MSSPAPTEPRRRTRVVMVVLARWILGGAFVYLGLIKALHPVDFLVMVRQYQVIENHTVLNLIAAALPWSEVVFGLMLLGGIAVRGTALTLLVLLAAFTGMVVSRAWTMHQEMG